MKAYERAHPHAVAEPMQETNGSSRRKNISLEVPALRDPRKQRALESLLRELAERLGRLLDQEKP